MTSRSDVDLTGADDRSTFRSRQQPNSRTQVAANKRDQPSDPRSSKQPDSGDARNGASHRPPKVSTSERELSTSAGDQISSKRSSKASEGTNTRQSSNIAAPSTQQKLLDKLRAESQRMSLKRGNRMGSASSGSTQASQVKAKGSHESSRLVPPFSSALGVGGSAGHRSSLHPQTTRSNLSSGTSRSSKRPREDESISTPPKASKRPKLVSHDDDGGQAQKRLPQQYIDLTELPSSPDSNSKEAERATSTPDDSATHTSATPLRERRTKATAHSSRATTVSDRDRESQAGQLQKLFGSLGQKHGVSPHASNHGGTTVKSKTHHRGDGSEAQRVRAPSKTVKDPPDHGDTSEGVESEDQSARPNESRDTSTSRPNGTGKSTLTTLSDNVSENNPKEKRQIEESSRKRQSRSDRPGRECSSEEDQGYVSLSASNADESSTKIQGPQNKDAHPVAGAASLTAEADDIPEEGVTDRDFIVPLKRSREQKATSSRQASMRNSPVRGKGAPGPANDRSQYDERPLSNLSNEGAAVPHGDLVNRAKRKQSRDSNPPDGVDRNYETGSAEADNQLRFEAMQTVEQERDSAQPEALTIPTARPGPMANAGPVYANVPMASQVELVLAKHLEEARSDTEYWTQTALWRARLSLERPVRLEASQNGADRPVSFANFKPINFSPLQKGGTVKSDQVWCLQKMGVGRKPQAALHVSAPYTTLDTESLDVPDYAHYVSITNNILAPNVRVMHCHPYFGEDFDQADAENLNDQYNSDIQDREHKLLLLLQAQKYEEYAETALEELGCSWADVLRFFLEVNPDVGQDREAQIAKMARSTYCNGDFNREGKRWTSVLAALPPSTRESLARVAVLCEKFRKSLRFSLWHIAWRSQFAELREKVGREEIESMTCRICLQFNCAYHGELKESPENEDESDSASESSWTAEQMVATDIIHPPRINYRTRVAFPPGIKLSAVYEGKSDKRDVKFWQSAGFNNKADERGPFYPCHHPGKSCEEAQAACSCVRKRIPCEKICGCPSDCSRKFQGCSCSAEKSGKGKRGVCFEDERCNCWQLGRECDPDLCGSCGVCEVVDPRNKYEDDVLIGRCKNAGLQRGVVKHTILGDSGVHGLGLYACEDIRQNELVGEYKGEIITKEEADRRGAVYEHQKLSYLFSLNATQEIDGTYFGNKMRFINHASGSKANLRPFIIMVNTVHRIALYASERIKPGEELFFDYGPKFPNEQLGGKKSRKSAPHVRNSGLVRSFLDVDTRSDGVENTPAKAIERAGKGKSKVRRPHRAKARMTNEDEDEEDRAEATGVGDDNPLPVANDVESELQQAFNERDAGQRLAAFNISDNAPSSPGDLDATAGAGVGDDSEEFDPDVSESEHDMSDESVMEIDEDDLTGRRRRGNPRKGAGSYGTGRWRR